MNAIIVGAGAYGEVYLHYLRQAGMHVVGFVDDDIKKVNSKIDGFPVLGTTAILDRLFSEGVTALYAPIGDNKSRVQLHEHARRHRVVTPNFIHSSAIVDSHVPPDSGIFIFPGSTVMPCSSIEPDVMISANVSVAHHTKLDQGVFLSTKASVGANVHIGRCAYIGMGGTIVTGKSKYVGSNSTIGAGAVVLQDIPDNSVAAGIPAYIIR